MIRAPARRDVAAEHSLETSVPTDGAELTISCAA
jgi:hypothetical protein